MTMTAHDFAEILKVGAASLGEALATASPETISPRGMLHIQQNALLDMAEKAERLQQDDNTRMFGVSQNEPV